MRTSFRSTIMAAVLGSVSVFTVAPAQAFGPVCVPRLQNCWCTYLRPCPVSDGAVHGTTTQMLAQFNIQNKLSEDLSKQLNETKKNVACNMMGSLPGINAVGLDINALLRAQLPNVDLQQLQIPGLDKLSQQLEDLSLNADMLQDVLNGEMTPDQFLNIAEQAGVDLSQLQGIGVTLSGLQGLANGNIDTLMSMGLDRIGVDLQGLGLGRNVLNNLAAGDMTVTGFLDMASAAGIGMPQLEAMGLPLSTLQSLSSGNISALGLPNIDAILNQVPRIGIDTGTIQAMLGGDVSPQRLLAMAESAGLDAGTLQSMGVSPQTIASLGNGQMSPQQLLEMSDALNFKATALNSLGINEDLLGNIANGNLSPQSIMNIANGAGLSLPDLQGLGLDPSSLASMVGQGPAGLVSTLQGAGLGNPILQGLNIDAGMLGKIATGELPVSAINDLLAGTGIDPAAIVIPGLDGAISTLGGLEDSLNGTLGPINDQLGQLNSGLANMINIPIPAIPGLGGMLGACGSGVNPDTSVSGMGGVNGANAGAPTPGGGAGEPTGGGGDGTGGGGGTGTAGSIAGTGAGSGAVCTPNRPLITSTQPPSTFTADTATLDFALAGQGDIVQQEEAISDAMSEAKRAYGAALARSITLKPIIPEALDSIKGIEDQMALIDANGTMEEAWKMNAAIKIHLLSAQAEVASLQTYLATMTAAQQVNPVIFTPLPLFPHDSAWEEQFAETIRPAAQEQIDNAAAAQGASEEYNNFHSEARAVRNAHENVIAANRIIANQPELIASIGIHEAQKESRFHMEQQIKSALAGLYEDPEAAWTLLRADIEGNSMPDGVDGRKWQRSANIADNLSDAVTAQTGTTRYGQRILIQPASGSGDTYEPAQYSTIAEMPYSYPYLEARLVPGEPIQAKRRVMLGMLGGSGDEEPPLPPLMSGGIQNYMETYRREVQWTGMRRGTSRTMSAMMWDELLDHAPECLTGPLPTTGENLLRRPELFDLSPSCSHLTWTDGDAEDYIQPSNLGGFDSVLWRGKIEIDKTRLETGAEDVAGMEGAVRANAQALAESAVAAGIETRLREVGYMNVANHTAALIGMLGTIAADTAFTASVPTPPLVN
jgi:hypothetical protein